MKKRFLSMLLCLVMVMALLPTAVFAEDGIQNVKDVAGFLAAIANGGSIRLMSNIALDSYDNMITKTVTLDLNSFTLTNARTFVIEVTNGGNLTIFDSSTDGTGSVSGDIAIGVDSDSIFTLNSGTINGRIWTDGTFTMNGGTVNSDSDNTITNFGTMYTNGGTVEGTATSSGWMQNWISVGENTKSTIFEGYVSNAPGATKKSVINGGIFNGEVRNYGGTSATYYYPAEITGGTFYGKVINEAGYTENGTTYPSGIISGGTFKGAVENSGIISGGMFYGGITNTDNGKIDGLTITYMNGGTEYAKQVLQSGETATKPIDPLGETGGTTVWYTETATVYDFSTAVTSDLTLYDQKDTQAPTITDIEDGKTYCDSSMIFSVTDNDQVASVTINGKAAATYTDESGNSYKFTEDMYTEGSDITVTATDRAGNAATVTIKLYARHNMTWNSNVETGKFWWECSQCGFVSDEMDIPYSTFKGEDMPCGTDTYTFTLYPVLNKVGEPKASIKEITTDIAGFNGEIKIEDFYENNICYAVVTITGIHTDSKKFNVRFERETPDKFTFEESYEVTIKEHSLTHTEAKEATIAAAGNKEYWYCSECEKYFSDAEGKNEFPNGIDDVTIPKLKIVFEDVPSDAYYAEAGNGRF